MALDFLSGAVHHHMRVQQLPSLEGEDIPLLNATLQRLTDMADGIVSRMNFVSPTLELSLKTLSGYDTVPELARLTRSAAWVRRKAFLCVLHASDLLDLTGRLQAQRAEREAEAAKRDRRKRRKRGEEEAESLSATTATTVPPPARGSAAPVVRNRSQEKVFLNLHRHIASFL